MPDIWTIGHSTRSFEALLALLRNHRIESLCDIRRFPKSRRHPHFNRESLEANLPAEGIAYHHIAKLGGFRGDYVAYTATTDFEEGLRELSEIAASRRTAFMCAEAVFFRCHRRFVSDVLVRRGVTVHHIMGPGKTYDHALREKPLETFA